MCEDCGCGHVDPVGEVTHFFGKPMVTVIKCYQTLYAGDVVQIKGEHTEFDVTLTGMRNENEEEIDHCHAGDVCAFKTPDKAREGDRVFLKKRETIA